LCPSRNAIAKALAPWTPFTLAGTAPPSRCRTGSHAVEAGRRRRPRSRSLSGVLASRAVHVERLATNAPAPRRWLDGRFDAPTPRTTEGLRCGRGAAAGGSPRGAASGARSRVTSRGRFPVAPETRAPWRLSHFLVAAESRGADLPSLLSSTIISCARQTTASEIQRRRSPLTAEVGEMLCIRSPESEESVVNWRKPPVVNGGSLRNRKL